MTVVSTANPRISNLVKSEGDFGRDGVTREEVVINVAAETVLTLGSVLGKVTASGKYVPVDHALANGAEDAAAVFLMGADAVGVLESTKVTIPAATDTTVIVLRPKTGAYAVVAEEALVFDVAHDATQKAAAIADLAAIGIHTKTQA